MGLVFLPNTEETAKLLQTVKPFCFWGKCSFKMIFNLVHKKAMFRNSEAPKERTILSDNTLIENALGDLGVLCTEDLAHVLHTNGAHFKEVSKRLWPIPMGEINKAGSMVHDERWTFGNQAGGMDQAITKLMGE